MNQRTATKPHWVWGKTQTHPTQSTRENPQNQFPNVKNWTDFIAREEEQGGRK
jgi:hypothetical protein